MNAAEIRKMISQANLLQGGGSKRNFRDDPENLINSKTKFDNLKIHPELPLFLLTKIIIFDLTPPPTRSPESAPTF